MHPGSGLSVIAIVVAAYIFSATSSLAYFRLFEVNRDAAFAR